MSNSIWDHPIATIEKALDLRKKIEALQETLSAVYSGSVARVGAKAAKVAKAVKAAGKTVDRRKGKRSPAARAKMAAAQKARWAKKKGASVAPAAPVAKTPRKKRTMSPEARAKIAAAQRARWAKQKAA